MLRLIGALWVPWVWFGNPDGQIWMERVFSEPEFSSPELANHPGHVPALVSRALLFEDDCQRRDELYGEAAALARRIGDDLGLACINWGRSELRLLPGTGAEARPFLEARSPGSNVSACPTGSAGATTTSDGPRSSTGNMTRLETNSNGPWKWPAATPLANGLSRTRWPASPRSLPCPASRPGRFA
jgi:hypothetical protein